MNLDRFIEAQEYGYSMALREIKNGRKVNHWMWYIFPQIIGLGESDSARYYAIKSLDEARAYLDNNILGPRLIEMCEELLKLNTNDSLYVFGDTDSMKLKSSMTLFNAVSDNNVFQRVLDKFYKGQKDLKTLMITENIEMMSRM